LFRRFATLRPQSLLLRFPLSVNALHFGERSPKYRKRPCVVWFSAMPAGDGDVSTEGDPRGRRVDCLSRAGRWATCTAALATGDLRLAACDLRPTAGWPAARRLKRREWRASGGISGSRPPGWMRFRRRLPEGGPVLVGSAWDNAYAHLDWDRGPPSVAVPWNLGPDRRPHQLYTGFVGKMSRGNAVAAFPSIPPPVEPGCPACRENFLGTFTGNCARLVRNAAPGGGRVWSAGLWLAPGPPGRRPSIFSGQDAGHRMVRRGLRRVGTRC